MQEATVSVATGAKINICLEILGLREDGYHELQSLFVPVPHPSDTLHLSPLPRSGGLVLSCSVPELAGETNILHKAYQAFAEATGERPGVEVFLEKGIPAGSGLGGGSADAAALLGYLNGRLPSVARLEYKELLPVAASVGSDVPFFLMNRPAWVTGAGEKVTAAEAEPSLEGLVIVCPDIVVSTAWAYGEYDRWVARGGGLDSLTRQRKGFKDCFCSSGQLWRNDFEAVVLPAYPELRSLKYRLFQLGARAVALNGSGSSLTALFPTSATVERCQRFLQQKNVAHYIAA